MKEITVKNVTKTEEVVDRVFCDICGKEINTKKQYFDVTTHHSDWGNDSIDSYEFYEICCGVHLKQFIKKWLDETKDSNTSGIEIEKTIGKGYPHRY